MLTILFIILLLTLLYYFLKSYVYNYWSKRGVPGPKPTLLVGNTGKCFLMKRSAGEIVTDIYHEYYNEPLVGMYRCTTPTLIIRDPELLKTVLVKEFKSFHDNELFADDKVDILFGRNPFVLRGERWKTVRGQLAPCFSSGKMKALYPLLQEISRQFVKFISGQEDAFNGKGVDAKELCTKNTLNNIATCAFGLDGKCFEDPNSEFKQMADKFLTSNTWGTIKFILVTLIPSLMHRISIKFVDAKVEAQLFSIVTETLRYREKNNIVRNDFLDNISQIKKIKDEEFTDLDITAHAASFFGDGYLTSAIIMSFLLYELAAHPEAQKKLREEILEKLDENGELSYEDLVSLPYLDAAFNESLRLHPAVYFLTKLCTESLTLNLKTPLVIEKGTALMIPTFGLHYDPKYWENPKAFIPERFLAENREKHVKYTYMPFGEGPRVCLGQRFGTLQIKVGVVQVIKNFEVTVNKKTQEPLKYDPLYFMLIAVGGLWLNFKKIEK